ncbi:hypothetical protein [Embleya sp. NPDC059259]|uniref:hypothetical protein n=1 Tax=unclassified Embleya TaxID=2699296 RepID=UPI00369BE3CF
MDAELPKRPKLWIDIVTGLPWLKSKPFLVENSREQELIEFLARKEFRLARVALPPGSDNPEECLLVGLTRELDFSELGAGSWAAYSDRLWDLQMSDEAAPVAVVVDGLDSLLRSDVHALVRCIHNLLSMTETVGLSDSRADLQIEYFFTGAWGAL